MNRDHDRDHDRDRIQSALADRYHIECELGAGGMATVYLAHDLKHDREVAIKVVHPDLARSLAGDRFLREIAITARLNHPHILALLDSGVAGDREFLYYVMPVATGESLRKRLESQGALPPADALRVAMDATDALVHAHGQHVVHRDIKPDNILLSGGHAMVVDFGIAKAVGESRNAETLTLEGTSLGTPAYMSPEQAAGDEAIDHRADIYAMGAVLFEMLAGRPAFAGGWQKVVAEKIAKDAPSLASACPDAPAALVRLVDQCLSRDPARRPDSAEALLAALRAMAAPKASAAPKKGRAYLWAGGATLAAVAVLATLYMRDRRARWVHETALPTITRLIDADQLDSAFEVAALAAERAPGDSAVLDAWSAVSRMQTFLSEPAGAEVARASVNDTTQWIPVGTTPTEPVRIPTDAWYYRYTKPGYRTVTVMGARVGGSYVPIPLPVALRKVTEPDSDMVLIRGKGLQGTMFGFLSTETFDLADYLVDKREVTNRQYQAFVDAGGYATPSWWDTVLVSGQPVPFSEAMRRFTDETGRPGPANWVGGAPPSGAEELPVGGVSWYEARAYARFAGKELPTVVEWNAAAIPEAARWVVPHGRYEASGPERGGSMRGVSPRGVYDMAGNVREWTANAGETNHRYILGGGWSDPAYLFSELYSQPPLDRSPINGIRLVRRLGESADLARARAPVRQASRDVSNLKPVDDATYRGFLALYEYDRTPLNAVVVSRDSSSLDWIREDIDFDLPGGGRMWAALYLPRRVSPPYQTVVLWPGADAFALQNRRKPSMSYANFFVRGGRAVLYPMYEHTHGRGSGIRPSSAVPSIAYRDQLLRWMMEMRRTIDYAETRADLDTSRMAYAGVSWGGRMGGVALAIEPRFRTALLTIAGLGMYEERPEIDPVNFLPHIRIPTIMLSGRFDSTYPLESSQKPFFRLLGTPAAQKRHLLFDGGHFLPRTLWVKESLAWLDKWLGPVTPL